jgi:hypothetical protein
MTNILSTQVHHPTTPARPSRRYQISWPITATLAAAFGIGIAEGAVSYAHRSPIREAHVAGTNAITVHLALAAAAALVVIVIQIVRSRRQLHGTPSPWAAPFSAATWARIRATLRLRHLGRAVAALPLVLLACYASWRIGAEVTGALDPNSSVNAWGGPTYLGALAAHTLDAVIGFYAASALLGKLLAKTAA